MFSYRIRSNNWKYAKTELLADVTIIVNHLTLVVKVPSITSQYPSKYLNIKSLLKQR